MFRVSVSTAQHDIGGSRTQQDNGFHAALEDKAVVAAVFDGHGAGTGQTFSAIAKETCQAFVLRPGFLEAFLSAPEDTGRAMFLQVHRACRAYNVERLGDLPYEIRDGLIHTPHLASIIGGSTGTVVIACHDGVVHTFHVGDSDAWRIGSNSVEPLHANHSPTSAEEYARIRPTHPETRFVYEWSPLCNRHPRKDGHHIFPKRPDFQGYYLKNKRGDFASLLELNIGIRTYKMAMTRAFGDEPMRHAGLTAIPSYKKVTLDESSIIRVATDGFWDNIVPEAMLRDDKHDYDADVLNREWFLATERVARETFGRSRDNMWGYTITVQKK